MAIDIKKSPESQIKTQTGPALERPDHNVDPDVVNDDGFEPLDDGE